MTFTKKDYVGLAALIVGLTLGSDLTKAQKEAKQKSAENQVTYGQPFLDQIIPEQMTAYYYPASLEIDQEPAKPSKKTTRRKIRKISQLKR